MTDQELKDLVASFAEDRKDLWRLIRETDQQMKESDRRREESDRQFNLRMEESDRRREEANRRIDQLMEETDRQMKELGRKVDKVCGKVGGVDENIGYHTEQFFQDVFERKKEFGGVKYDEVIPNFGRNDDIGKIEIDITMINGNSVALIEVKNRIHPDFVKEFAQERVKKFRTLCHEYKDYKIYLGIAGFSFDDTVLTEAKEYGVGVVKQAGEGIEVETDCLKAY